MTDNRETPTQWQERTGTHKLKRVQRKGFKAYKCLEGDHKGEIVRFELVGMNYLFHSVAPK